MPMRNKPEEKHDLNLRQDTSLIWRIFILRSVITRHTWSFVHNFSRRKEDKSYWKGHKSKKHAKLCCGSYVHNTCHVMDDLVIHSPKGTRVGWIVPVINYSLKIFFRPSIVTLQSHVIKHKQETLHVMTQL